MKSQGNGEIEKNEEHRQLYQMRDIIREIKKRRLPWAGNVWRNQGMLVLLVQCGAPKGRDHWSDHD